MYRFSGELLLDVLLQRLQWRIFFFSFIGIVFNILLLIVFTSLPDTSSSDKVDDGRAQNVQDAPAVVLSWLTNNWGVSYYDYFYKLFARAPCRNLSLDEIMETSAMAFVLLIILQLGLSISTLATLFLIVLRFKWVLHKKRLEWSGISDTTLIVSKGKAGSKSQIERYLDSYSLWKSLIWRCIGELLIHAVHPIIFMNKGSKLVPGQGAVSPGITRLYYVLSGFMFLRLYLLFQLFYSFGIIHSEQVHKQLAKLSERVESQVQDAFERFKNNEISHAAFEEKLNNLEDELLPSATKNNDHLVRHERFYNVAKIFLFTSPVSALLIIGCSSIILAGVAVFLFERGTQPSSLAGFGNLGDGIWYAFTVFMTIGYGDLVADSLSGRIVTAALSVLGLMSSAVFSGLVVALMRRTREESFVGQYLQMHTAQRIRRNAAAHVIQHAWWEYRPPRDLSPKQKPASNKPKNLESSIKRFQRSRWMMRRAQNTQEDPVIESQINHLSLKIGQSMEFVQKANDIMISTSEAIEEFKKSLADLL